MLIILRGNSGSGKTSTARLLRDTAIERTGATNIALVEQDYLRRHILKEREMAGRHNVALIEQTVRFALQRGYHVILEGILYSVRYRPLLQQLIHEAAQARVYYFDIPLEETLIRHQTKPNAHEFGEAEMRDWYRERDVLGLAGEILIGPQLSQPQIIEKILAETGLASRRA